MAGDEPPLKKLKFHDNQEFLFFHKHKLDVLESAYSVIKESSSGYGVTLSKIKVCDAQSQTSFANATCKCEELHSAYEEHPKGYSIINIFQYGIDMIEAYIESPERIPQRKGAQMALLKLLKFLSDIATAEKALSHLPAHATEMELTVAAAHHMLSKLTVASTYILDKVSTGKKTKKNLKCTCGCEEELTGTYGETSLGVPSFWHGRVDILMDVPVRTLAPEDTDSPGAGNKSSIEMKSTIVKMASSRNQIRAETIVFSFLVKKKHPELDNFLIPTIAMSRTHVAICLYDSEEDMLLETPLLSLFQHATDKILNKATIVTLWLALNFKYCCSGIPEEITDTGFKADFFKHIGPGPVLESYRKDVTAPCSFVTENEWFVLPKFEILKRKTKDVNKIDHPQEEKKE